MANYVYNKKQKFKGGIRMVEIRELMEEDIPKYTGVFLIARELFGDFTGEYFKVIVEGEENVLHFVEDENYNLYTLYLKNEDGTFNYTMFSTDKENKILQVGYEDFEANFSDGQTVLRYRDEKHSELLCVRRRSVPDYDGMDGSIIYAQYDAEKDERAIMTFNQIHFENNKNVYETRVRTPFSIQFEEKLLASQEKGKNAKTTTYISRTFDAEKESLLFGLTMIKDYGLERLLSTENGTFSLQREDHVTRYFKVLFVSKEEKAVVGYPFCKQYTQEEMEELLERRGFQGKVPKLIMNIHNGNDKTLMVAKDIVAQMSEIRKLYEEVDVRKLELELGFGSGENHENS